MLLAICSLKHPITFRFGALAKLRALVKNIDVEVEGIADTNGYIMDFTDVATDSINETYTNMGEFIITGYRLKVEGDHPDVGLYFEEAGGGTTKLKAGKLAVNTSSKLIGIFPAGAAANFKIVIKTQYSGGGNFLKDIRTIESRFILTK